MTSWHTINHVFEGWEVILTTCIQLTDEQITEELEKVREQRFSLQKQLRKTNIKLEKLQFEQNRRRRQKTEKD
ncbi:hypothetical protein Glove_476g76 [Diversispora epigaea]|uniref:Uncharacterized protein n=1 Tax=Diversispora epigaea TaxID=1348612 RepID=A0A397GRB5_9GLOM|nr:hypothetical protein Glove_476g76 [Diversispora epigaea]